MNQIRRHEWDALERDRIREILAGQSYPDFVTSFDFDTGTFEEIPALWITLHLTGSDQQELAELERRADSLLPLQEAVHAGLAAAGIDRFPFFRVAYPATTQF